MSRVYQITCLEIRCRLRFTYELDGSVLVEHGERPTEAQRRWESKLDLNSDIDRRELDTWLREVHAYEERMNAHAQAHP